MSWYRLYFRKPDGAEEAHEIKWADGDFVRMCDDHGRVVAGEPWPKKDYIVFPGQGRECPAFRDD